MQAQNLKPGTSNLEFGMKKIDLLVLKSYIGPLVLTFFIAIFVLLMQFLWKYVDDLVGKGLPWNVVAELMFYASSTFVPMALPLAILLSSLMTFGNLGEHYELVATKAAGVSLRRIMAPLIILSVMIGIGAFYFSNIVLPIANLKFRAILYDVRQQKLSFNIKEGIYYDGLEGYVIRVGEKERDGKIIRDVMIYDHTDRQGNTNITLAEWGSMDQTPDGRFLILTLYNGFSYDDNPERSNPEVFPFLRMRFSEEVRRFDLSGFELNRTDEDLFRNNLQMYNLRQLEYSRDSLTKQFEQRRENFAKTMRHNYYYFSRLDPTKDIKPDSSLVFQGDFLFDFEGEERAKLFENALSAARSIKTTLEHTRSSYAGQLRHIRRHDIEWHRKYTLSVACLILFFVGAPLGAIIRKGGLGLPLVVSTILFVLFHIASTTGDKYVRTGVLDSWVGMWLSSALFLPLGIWLTYKAVTDSPLMDSDAWGKLFRKRKLKNTENNNISA
jgi:lipopolysaccharide export system permease protein